MSIIDDWKGLRDAISRSISYMEAHEEWAKEKENAELEAACNGEQCHFQIGDYMIYRRARNLEPSCQPVTHNPQEEAFYRKVDP